MQAIKGYLNVVDEHNTQYGYVVPVSLYYIGTLKILPLQVW